MRKRMTMVLVGVMLVALAATGITLGLIIPDDSGQTVSGGTVVTTEDIGARVGEHVELKSASFRPNLTDAEAIALAREFLREGMHLANPETLPVRATVATFTGEPHIPRPFVRDLKVRVVVFDDYPAWPRVGPGVKVRPTDSRYTVILDDETGEVVYSLLTWGIPGQE